MKRCLILRNEEIEDEECALITAQSHMDKFGKELPKRIKVVSGWDIICKNCSNHCEPKKNKKRR